MTQSEDDYPDIPCMPPRFGEVGDVWYCSGCARKFHYVKMTSEDETMEVWFTNETR